MLQIWAIFIFHGFTLRIHVPFDQLQIESLPINLTARQPGDRQPGKQPGTTW
jgi:hypothetical protein